MERRGEREREKEDEGKAEGSEAVFGEAVSIPRYRHGRDGRVREMVCVCV